MWKEVVTLKSELMFFNEQGILDLDEMLLNNESFKAIMADGEVTDEEIKAQSERIIAILHDMETKYTEEQLAEIKTLLVETSVLYAVYNYNSLLNLLK